MPNPVTDPALQRFRAALRSLRGERLERAVLYGSRARGDLLDDTGEFVNAMPYRAKTYADHRMPSMHEIRREGIVL